MNNVINWSKGLIPFIVDIMSLQKITGADKIPNFPIFLDIKISHKDFVSHYANKYCHSTFNFSNFWAWDIRNTRKISSLNGNLVFLMQDYETGEPFFTFAGDKAPKSTAEKLLRYAEKFNYLPELRYIPEDLAKKIKTKKLSVEKDENNSEYVYKTKFIAESNGKKLKTKRNRIKAFKRDHPDAVFSIKKLSPNLLGEIDHLFELWESQTSKSDREMNVLREHTALLRLVKYSPNTNLLLSTVYEKNRLLSFSIDEIINKDYAIGHFAKADRSIKGIYEFINENTANYFFETGIEFWNWQQDLGITGLKKLKLSYHPTHFMKKYTVKLKN